MCYSKFASGKMAVGKSWQGKTINLCGLSHLQAKKQKNNQPVSRVVCLCKWGKTTINLRSCRKHEKTQQQSTDTACRGRNKKKHNKVKQQSSCVAAFHGRKRENKTTIKLCGLSRPQGKKDNQPLRPVASARRRKKINW